MEAEQERDTRDELWKVLVTQLRAQLASREAAGELEETCLDEPLRNELFLAVRGNCLSVWLDTDTGKGSWNVITEKLQEAEPWLISVDGKVELSGEIMDIPTLVERFVEKVSTK